MNTIILAGALLLMIRVVVKAISRGRWTRYEELALTIAVIVIGMPIVAFLAVLVFAVSLKVSETGRWF